MKPLVSCMNKEVLEAARTGKITFLMLLFALLGIMNPAIAKLTPWLMETMADSMAESGLIVTNVRVDAMTSWYQFFKNIPLLLIVFVLIFSDLFTKEYKSGTLLLVLSKGLSRYKIVLSKAVLLLSLWTLSFGLCFAVTYGYNAYFWDNGIANHLFLSAALWWLFGVWVICLVILFSSLLRQNTGVILCTGGVVLLVYLSGLLLKVKAYSPMMLTDIRLLLTGASGMDAYSKAIIITAVMCTVCVVGCIPILNKKQL